MNPEHPNRSGLSLPLEAQKVVPSFTEPSVSSSPRFGWGGERIGVGR